MHLELWLAEGAIAITIADRADEAAVVEAVVAEAVMDFAAMHFEAMDFAVMDFAVMVLGAAAVVVMLLGVLMALGSVKVLG